MRLSSKVADVEECTQHGGDGERPKRQRVGPDRGNFDSGDFSDQELDIGRRINIAEPCPHPPMPVGTWGSIPSRTGCPDRTTTVL